MTNRIGSAIEVDLSSGLPNRSFPLSADDEAELLQLIAELPAGPGPTAPFDGLGYRGILIHLRTRPGAALRLFRGVLSDARDPASRLDSGGALLEWITARIDHAGEANLAAWLRGEP